MLPSTAFSNASEADVFCQNCRTSLPTHARFCLQCGAECRKDGKAVTAARQRGVRPKSRLWIWLLLPALVLLLAWAGVSDVPIARQFQEVVGWSHAQTITNATVSIKPLNFVFYKFTVPPGALDVALTGQFTASGGSDADKGVEAFVLTDTAFIVWRKGYATGTQYESGKVAQAALNATLPRGAGIYYLVFSNKSSPRQAQTVEASVLLRYKSWVPDAIRGIKDQFAAE